MLKDLIRHYIVLYRAREFTEDQATAKILNLFKSEVDKLTELTDEEVGVILEAGFNFNTKPTSLEHIQRIIQLEDAQKQLLDLMEE